MVPGSRRLAMIVAATLLVLAVLWAVGDRPPRMPADGDHGVEQSELSCLSCHGVSGRAPRPPDHPPRDDCYSCHRDAGGRLHPRRDAPTELPGGWREMRRRDEAR
ncbi:MAG: hypothetical protein HRF46_00285 [Acidobacteriota bacterium]